MKMAVVMDPIAQIHPETDTSLAILLEGQRRGMELFYLEAHDLSIENGIAYGWVRPIHVFDDLNHWYELGDAITIPLGEMDFIFMRKDPPFDMEYLYCTHILDLAQQQGALVVNRPQSLRDANEKLFATHFPDLMPASLVTTKHEKIQAFLAAHHTIVAKPLDAKGGQSVFLLKEDDVNTSVILETMTAGETRTIMLQRFVPEVVNGDRRILLIHGEAYPFAMLRTPAKNSIRSNIVAGGQPDKVPLRPEDEAICARLKPVLQRMGLYFVGIDVIGDKLTEINVTCPTGARYLEHQHGEKVIVRLFDGLVA